MPSFGRIGKHSNRSQHNLVEQQQQQQHHHLLLQQQQQQQQQLSSHQQQVAGSGAAAPPHHPLQQQQTSGATASTTSLTSPATVPSPLNGGRRVSAAGVAVPVIGQSVPVSVAVAESNTTPPSASSIGLSSSESFQQQQQLPLPPPPLSLQADTRATQPQLQTQQQTPHTSPHQLQHQHHHQISGQQQSQPAQPLEAFGSNPSNNLPTNPIPLNQASAAAYTARQQPHDNFAELVSRSQSARYSQLNPLQTQHPFGVSSSSVDNLPQTVSSPVVPPSQPPVPHSQTAPTEPKRSARKLIKNFIAGSSSSNRPTSDHYQDASYDNGSGLTRRPSKRASNTPAVRGSSLLSRPIDHPDWVQPPSTGSRSHHHSPIQPVRDLDDPYYTACSNQDMFSQNHQDLSRNTIRQVPTDPDPDPDTSPYGHEDLAFHQQQAIVQHQAHLQAQAQAQAQIQAHAQAQAQAQAQVQAQVEQQQQLYGGQIVVDPAQNQYQYAPPYEQYQAGDRRPSLFTGHLSAPSPQPPNPETVSQVSHESPDSDSDYQQQQQQQSQANSRPAQDSPAVSFAPQDPQSSQNQQQPSVSTGQTPNMAPPPGGPGQSRRSGDHDKQMRSVEPPPGPPPGYRHSQGPLSAMNPLPPTPGVTGAPQNYRTSGVQDRPQFDGPGPEGRNSPQPSNSAAEREADPEKQFKDLLTKYKNVKRLYFDGKAQIELLTSQVEQLQNAVANQRMSQSRTALDDNEYSTRFNRLNGAINNLSFNIRKDWRTLPGWIERYVSPEAIKTGKQEMTAVGRAVIMRWIVEEIFNKCFHPGLDMHLSSHLKEIEQNIRRFSYTLNSQEEFEALTAKVVNWRMATLEGLQHMLQAPESAEYRADFTKMATSNLTATLFQYLTDPPPTGVDGSASMIVELAVGIAANLPLESRDVAITYPLPGDPIRLDIMELEKTGLPPLPEPAEDADEGNDKDGDKAKRDKSSKSGMLTMLGGSYPSSRKGSAASVLTDTTTSAAAAAAASAAVLPPKDPNKVRFAGFVAIEVRGRQVLVKAPVWSLG
ncbi:hypothetical protein F4781DRAFT_429374 [Annulohypoxylon bovei var. microspora]|nr:hypothetical protein F4781DRAFT_429374 [Annulohypoxylon bovei var. microspora]